MTQHSAKFGRVLESLADDASVHIRKEKVEQDDVRSEALGEQTGVVSVGGCAKFKARHMPNPC